MKRLITALFLLTAPLLAKEFPWVSNVPQDLVTHFVQPDTVLDEIPCDWRPVLTPLVKPLVSDCRDAREATLRLASTLRQATGVYYSTERSKHNMNVLEALAEKKVSCTGQSILLICALRSVGIPARAVGVATWNHIEGNHTWAEAWFDGGWHMIEYNEKDFNTSWVMENIGMLNPLHPWQRVRAASPRGNDNWTIPGHDKPEPPRAKDVTERYLKLAHKWYAGNGLNAETQRLLIDCTPRLPLPPVVELVNEENKVLGSVRLPASTDDMRYLSRLSLPREGRHYLRLQGRSERMHIPATPAPVQILRLP